MVCACHVCTFWNVDFDRCASSVRPDWPAAFSLFQWLHVIPITTRAYTRCSVLHRNQPAPSQLSILRAHDIAPAPRKKKAPRIAGFLTPYSIFRHSKRGAKSAPHPIMHGFFFLCAALMPPPALNLTSFGDATPAACTPPFFEIIFFARL